MLRKSSASATPIASKQQAIMADNKTLSSSPSYTYNKSQSSSFFNSPRNFTTFTTKGGSVSGSGSGFSNDSESLISPTSILDSSKSSSAFIYPFCSSDVVSIPKDSKVVQWEKLDCKGVGLGILDALAKGNSSDSKKSKTKSPAVVLFSSKLKIEIPSSYINEDDSLKSPSDFGIKTRNSHVCPFSVKNSSASLEKSNSRNSKRVLSGLSITEMENSEEYTCVVSYGSNPKTTHIFDDCVIESFPADIGGGGGGGGVSSTVNEKECFNHPSESFLSFCNYKES